MLPYYIEVVPIYLNGFQPDRHVMSLNSKNSSLRILDVDISDSGLYYCGWHNQVIRFGDGKNLDIKGNLSLSTAYCEELLAHIIYGKKYQKKYRILLQSTDIKPYDFQMTHIFQFFIYCIERSVTPLKNETYKVENKGVYHLPFFNTHNIHNFICNDALSRLC